MGYRDADARIRHDKDEDNQDSRHVATSKLLYSKAPGSPVSPTKRRCGRYTVGIYKLCHMRNWYHMALWEMARL
jgi:hypothetical protein